MKKAERTEGSQQHSGRRLPPKKHRGIWWVMKRALIVLVLMMLLLVAMNFRLLPGPNSRLVRPSPETTWITEPLKPNGDVDYLAWVNEQGRIPPEENAFVELAKILGPDDGSFQLKDEVCSLLGMTPLPAGGDYLERFRVSMEGRPGLMLDTTINGVEIDGLYAQLIMEAVPFSANQFPEATKWFERNEHHLIAMQRAVRKPSFWAPRTGNLFADLPLSSTGLRDIGRTLQRSSMRHLGNHHAKLAIEDQIAILRFARHVCRNGSMTDLLMGIAMNGVGHSALAHTIYRNDCSQEELELVAYELGSLSPPPQMNVGHFHSTRVEGLELLLMMGRSGPLMLDLMKFGAADKGFGDTIIRSSIDWTVAFQTFNEWGDRFELAFEAGTVAETADLLAQITAELEVIESQAEFAGNLQASLLGGPMGRGRFVGNRLSADLYKSVFSIFKAGLESKANHEVTLAAVAVERYRLKNGSPPGKLEDVVPGFLTEVPIDPFSGEPLVYRLDAERGYLLYSVGRNRKDDGGRNQNPAEGSDVVAHPEVNSVESWIEKHIPKTPTIIEQPGFQP